MRCISVCIMYYACGCICMLPKSGQTETRKNVTKYENITFFLGYKNIILPFL